MEENTVVEKTSGITSKDKIGYALGDFSSLLVFGLVQSVLQKYYTDVVGVGVVSIMIMFIVARIWDAINDPLWGRIIDRAPAKASGRYRRWLQIFALPVALAAVLMFIRIPGLSETGNLIFAYVTYILFGMLYTCINIPYGSLAQVMTSSDKERSTLSVFRSIGSTFGAMPAMALISLCYVKMKDPATGEVIIDETTGKAMTVMSYQKILIGVIIIAVLCVIGFSLAYKWTKERVKTEPAKVQKGQAWKVIKVLLKSRPFVAVCFASMLFLAAQMFGQSYMTYLFHYYFDAPGLSFLPTVCQYLPVAVIMFVATKMGNRFGRREVCAYGILLAGVCNLVLYLMNTHNVFLYLVVLLLSGIGNAFIFLLVWALANDAMDYNEVKYGLQDTATSYAFYSFMRKLGQTIAAILVNAALLRIGYSGNVLNTNNITDTTLRGMYAYSVLIPAVLYILVFILLRFVYPLGKKQIDDLQKDKAKA
ncbi:MAG: MFS transporter [Lachnospiraceae bacterium]|nr:MFS transporter [Lachnospiraceae bacterium]